ncbi:transcription antiterminator BglG [Clostridium gelidum]|uniref:Transcription antiterminator BglG n=1 Tax=Clostridium gelidum TaxID=704125 RepID=A0ABN6IU72_9CLOT|nr:PRD domain-containing protein [Clostridium gelidum]BCZ45118.1 transcription antiterminator BglG [Clostridium gelidum]
MQVIKKINNNVALALNDKKEEVIIMGKGVGFPSIPYDLVDESIIETIYVTPKNMKAFELLNAISSDTISLAEEIIRFGENYLNKKVNSIIFLTLTDHIDSAIERYHEAIKVNNPLQWEIKRLYPMEQHIGIEALKIIELQLGIQLPSSEASFIALHFVNAQMGSNELSETTKVTSISGEIINIVKYHFKINFDEESINFTRFVTHVMYFVRRQVEGKTLENENELFYEMIKEKYKEELTCVEKIEKYINKNYGWNCSNDEKLYLLLHIQRLKN